MLIQHKLVGDKGMFFVGQDGAILAELVYNKPTEDRMIIEHTEVDDSLSGKGVGLQLVTTAIDYARTHNMKITPCSFARSVFKRHPEYSDVLA